MQGSAACSSRWRAYSTADSRAGNGVSRRNVLRIGALAGSSALIPGIGNIGWAYAADDKPAIGTWPAGSEGDTVNVAAAVPLTGAYAVQGADELKGWELAVEHINTGHELMKAIAPKIDNGLLGKKVNLLSADSAAKPNQAVELQQKFINENKSAAVRFAMVHTYAGRLYNKAAASKDGADGCPGGWT